MRCALVVVLVACGSREAPPSSGSGSAVPRGSGSAIGSAVATGSTDAGGASALPPGPLPVTLPAVDAHSLVVAEAASFVIIDKLGAKHFGPIGAGAAPYVGFEANRELDAALDAIAPPKGTAMEAPPEASEQGTGQGYAPPMPTMGLLIRGIESPSIDTIVFADKDVDAGVVTDTIAGFAKARVVGLGVANKSNASRFALAFQSLPPRKTREVGSGVAFVVSARGVTWWVSKPGGSSEVVETRWADDARGKLVAWAKQQHSLKRMFVAIEIDARLSHLMEVLGAIVEAGATDIELARRYAVDGNGYVINARRQPLNVESTEPLLGRSFKQRSPQLWECVLKGREAKPRLTGAFEARFAIQDNFATNLEVKGSDPAVDECIGDVIREIRFVISSSATLDVKVSFPKN